LLGRCGRDGGQSRGWSVCWVSLGSCWRGGCKHRNVDDRGEDSDHRGWDQPWSAWRHTGWALWAAADDDDRQHHQGSAGPCAISQRTSVRGTGAWNAWAVRDELHGSYAVLCAGELVAVVLSGLTAWLHARAMTPAVRGGLGAATAAFAQLAVLLGVQLTL